MNLSNFSFPAGALVLITAVVLLVDWNLTGGFGTLSRACAWTCLAAFVAFVVVAITNSVKEKKHS